MKEMENGPVSSRRGAHRTGVHSGKTSDSGRKDVKWNFRLQPQTCKHALENTLKFSLFNSLLVPLGLSSIWTEVDFL